LSLFHFTLMYECWKQPDHDGVCTCVYYDMRHKGLRTLRSPPTLSSAAADVKIPIGIDATGHGQHIRDRLALMYTQHDL
jgi:hypothetical protein